MTEKRVMEIIRARPFQEWTGKDPMTIPCRETSDAARLCKHPVVSVDMLAYNHEPFIRQAIEGVMMQKTDFEFELVIGEDCSTDKTREICFEYQKKFPDKIRVLWSEENLCQHPHPAGGNSRRVQSHCRGEFVAFCEGDDYWTDPTKLQRQVDVMHRHPEVSLCTHRYQILSSDGSLRPAMRSWAMLESALAKSGEPDGFLFNARDPFEWLIFQTATVMYRKSLFDMDFYNRAKFHCDIVSFHAALKNGPGYFINREMSVYRQGEQGVYSRMPVRRQCEFDLRHHWAIYDADPNPDTEACYRATFRPLENLEFPRCVFVRLRCVVSQFIRRVFHLGAVGERTWFNLMVDRIRN